ncbi:MAG: NADH-quinone oxidoreductase subunit C [Nitrososphaera sp.]
MKESGGVISESLMSTLEALPQEKIKKIQLLNGNEIHVKVSEAQYVPEICNHVQNASRSRLVMMICSDERQLGLGFALRHVFEAEGRDLFIFVTSQCAQSGPDGAEQAPSFPSVVLQMPSAALYEREIKDMFGLSPEGNPDTRPLVLHEQWPRNRFPLRKDFELCSKADRVAGQEYKFAKLEGEGICEIPVGPVHAGIIEPGHFRFSIRGENILNLETRLYYTHKGIEKRAESMTLEQAVLLSERISGDEAVANSLAYCQAIEKLGGARVPERALLIRTLCAEMERTYNHIGTLAGMTTDVGFSFGAARLNILKERMMSLNEQVSGSRLLFGVNRLGGVGIDVSDEVGESLEQSLAALLDDFNRVLSMLKSKSSVTDRLRNTGTIPKQVAVDLSLVGIAARCAGIDVDTRRDHPYAAYPTLQIDLNHDSPQNATRYSVEMQKRVGDALSRFDVRAEEVVDSIRIARGVVCRLLKNAEKDLVDEKACMKLTPYSHALGYAESHRGQTLHWVEIGGNGSSLFRYKIRTASFSNWPAIEQAVLSDIIPDFPLVNKSLDLSYSGNDL